MDKKELEAIYRDGVLEPLESVDLPEEARVRIVVESEGLAQESAAERWSRSVLLGWGARLALVGLAIVGGGLTLVFVAGWLQGGLSGGLWSLWVLRKTVGALVGSNLGALAGLVLATALIIGLVMGTGAKGGLALIALGLALLGQLVLVERKSFKGASLLYAGALLTLTVLVWWTGLAGRVGLRAGISRWAQSLVERVRGLIDAHFTRIVLVILALVVDLLAILLLSSTPAGTRGPRWDVFALWVGAILLCLIATLQLETSWFSSVLRARGRWLSRERGIEIGLVILLTGAAFALRFVGLGGAWELLDGDEGVLGSYVVGILRGDVRDMFATYRSFGTLYLFLLALPVRVFGVSAFGLRFTGAVAGSLTVPMLYLLGRRLFDARVGFVAAAMLALSHYHLHFSRVVPSGNAVDALVVTVLLWLFYRGLEERSRNSLVLSGLVLGLAQYMYSGSRLTGVIIIAYVFLVLLLWRRVGLDNLGNLALCVLMAFVVSLPMIRWALTHPGEYMGQVQAIGVFQTGWLAHEAAITGQPELLILARQVATAFLSLIYYDVRGFYDATIPVLGILSSALFVLGLGYSLLRIGERRFLLLNIWFWSGLVIGGALLVNPDVAVYRILIVFPAVALFTAVGLLKLVELATQELKSQPQLTLIIALAFIAVVGFLNIRYYFSEYIPGCRYPDSDTAAAAVAGEYLRDLGLDYQAFFLGSPSTPIDGYQNLPFLSGRRVRALYGPMEAAADKIDAGRPMVFFVRPYRGEDLRWLQERFPGGSIVELRRCDELLVTVYRVDAS